MRRSTLAAVLCGLPFAAACGSAMSGTHADISANADASATLINAQGATIGTAWFTARPDGSITIDIAANGMPPGNHGIHLHAIGSCDAPAFESAGGHFNPTARQHGLENPAGPHGGDLENILATSGGHVSARSTTSRATLGAGSASILDADGTAIVIHATADDNRTDPSGNSGARIACGVIKARS